MNKFKDFFTLCKPKVVLVMLITAWVGMFLSTPLQNSIPFSVFLLSTLGIAFAAGSAAVINHMADRHIDAKMSRTELRPIASGRITPYQALLFSFFLGLSGLSILYFFINPLTAWLTFATVIGYALLYTLFLKYKTPQNIVIGGAAGATPPLLGWAAVSNELTAFPWLLVLIIFAWTPPHFWALAIHRLKDYQKAKVPMLPVTHGVPFTKLCIVLYTILLILVTLLPFVVGMSGWLYLWAALVLGTIFLVQALLLFLTDSKSRALKTFNFSIVYLLLLFFALLLDHALLNP